MLANLNLRNLVVSAASGAVGSVVGQLGKLIGCKVIGIAGGPKKSKYVTEELKFDKCIDYKNENVVEKLENIVPMELISILKMLVEITK